MSEQVELFALPSESRPMQTMAPPSALFDWRAELTRRSTEKAQFDFNDAQGFTLYRSGSSNYTDAQALVDACAPIGICIIDSSGPTRTLLAEYASDGGKVFIDSGAFRVFRRHLAGHDEHLDFNAVLARYAEIVAQCTAPEQLLLVAPDIVGDQHGSFEIFCRYLPEVQALARAGARIVLPMQVGKLDMLENYQRYLDVINFEPVVGLPANAKSISADDALSFLRAAQPSHVHFLGCSETCLLHQAAHVVPHTDISSDAMTIRKHIGTNKLLTEMCRQQTDDTVIDYVHGGLTKWDETEFVGYIDAIVLEMSNVELKRFANSVSMPVNAVLDAAQRESLMDNLDELHFGYGYEMVSAFWRSECRQAISPEIRRCSITTLYRAKLI
ncbi:hypothetical protein IC617_08535 [Neiella sp. HB171785]|uniref:Uncharacterized protein n=1 Tax=Neiella litorisoli TaxID=2771431 RepID=A0A8J6QIY2_9GAMM|nr:hypothetical protein [Neiella litorisoli]MBD1389472.1 hypothetical protein [Neiella litorisoli]